MRSFSLGLSALRGCAALGVVIYHAMLMIPVAGIESPDKQSLDITRPTLFLQQLLFALFNGRGLVVLFFVLSGCVLALSLDGRGRFSASQVPGYWLRRGARLYPLLILSATIAALLELYWFDQRGLPGGSAWANSQHRIPDDDVPYEWFVNAIGYSSNINTPAWSISVELLGSLLFPLIYWASLRPITAALAVIIGAAVMFLPGDPKAWLLMNVYLFSFVIGALIPRYGPALVRRLHRLPPAAGVVSTMATFAAFMFARALIAPAASNPPMVVLIETLSAAIIVALLLFRPTPRLIGRRWVQSLGRISYGLYLLHLLVLFAIAELLLPALPPPDTPLAATALIATLLLTALAITLPLAWLIHRWFEVPTQPLGRALAKRPRRPFKRVGAAIPVLQDRAPLEWRIVVACS